MTKIRTFYLILSLLGIAIPYYHFILFLIENGVDVPLFFEMLFANRISAFFGWDVIVSAAALIPFIIMEGRRRKVKHYWFAVVGTCVFGVSFGLPFFLYLREAKQQPSDV